MLQWFPEVHPYFYFYSCNWDQMGLSIRWSLQRFSRNFNLILSQWAISVFIFCMSVKSLLKQWLTGPQCHWLTSQLDEPCGWLLPLHQATSHNKTCDVLQPRKDFAKFWQSCWRYFTKQLGMILRTGISVCISDRLTETLGFSQTP